MSTRAHLVSITSIDPIRDAVASNDVSLVESVLAIYEKELRSEGYDEETVDYELEEYRENLESMILCRSPLKSEPGCWNYLIKLLAKHFKLKTSEKLPFNNHDWKHYHVWESYRPLVANHITPQSKKSLKHLEDGRPLKGSRIDHDGCAFGWLALDEVKELYHSLSQLDKALITDRDLLKFHDGLIKSLKIISDRNDALFMAAH